MDYTSTGDMAAIWFTKKNKFIAFNHSLIHLEQTKDSLIPVSFVAKINFIVCEL